MNKIKKDISSIAQLLKKSALTLTAAAVLGGVIPGAGTLPVAQGCGLE